tara:strand:- start:3566 stop:4090 length:525 start_codon:yes stop_codon:yes gene_type:complete
VKNKFIVIIFLLFACHEIVPRRPVNKMKSTFISQSAKLNKNRLLIEQKLFQKVIKLDPKKDFLYSPMGFMYSILEKKENKTKPVKGDLVEIKYKIEDINKNLLYSEEELNNLVFLVDREEIIPALREGVKVLSVGETGIFLFPSYLCYGYQGDFEKIAPNQPLRITIKLLSLTK